MAFEVRDQSRDRLEAIRLGSAEPVAIGPGVWLREFAGKKCGARDFSTGTATFEIGATLPYHAHSFSEAITVINGTARVAIEGRQYLLQPFDSVHVPADVAHEVSNHSPDSVLLALSAFASAEPLRRTVEAGFDICERGYFNPSSGDPESIVRFAQAECYELSSGAEFRDLFAGRFGSVGICGGYGRFLPDTSLPCHIHDYDESITIVEGSAVCLVEGRRYELSGCDTAVVPQGRPHRFLNHSNSPMAMVWVYAGSEPERTLVESSYCDGTLAWPG
jgi:putative monooxygenase